jgi:CDP-diacylglycerol--glycerol-3-phosphate 3-phosphatidyltransferase
MGKQLLHARLRGALDPLVRVLVRLGVSPLALTLAGLVLSMLAGVAVLADRSVLAGLLLLAGGLCDTMDGPVARLTQRQTKSGAFLDSTIDRYSEVAIFLALAWRFRGEPTLVAVFLAITGSLLVSYARARAEGLREECRIGLLERPERLVLLIAGLFVGWNAVVAVLWLLAVLTHVTALQRILYVARRTSGKALAES